MKPLKTWNSMRILVPHMMVYRTQKTGKEKEAPTLTKTSNLATRGGLKSIVLVPDSSISKPVFEDMEMKSRMAEKPPIVVNKAM